VKPFVAFGRRIHWCGVRSYWWQGLLALARVARADDSNTDIARLTMGSPVFPKGSWAFELTPIYAMHSWSNSASDTLQPDVSIVHAFTERLTLALGYQGLDGPRASFRPAEINVEGRYLVLEAPFLLAPYLLVGVPFLNQPANALVGAQALKNIDAITLRVVVEGEGDRTLNGVAFRGNFEGGLTTGSASTASWAQRFSIRRSKGYLSIR